VISSTVGVGRGVGAQVTEGGGVQVTDCIRLYPSMRYTTHLLQDQRVQTSAVQQPRIWRCEHHPDPAKHTRQATLGQGRWSDGHIAEKLPNANLGGVVRMGCMQETRGA